jgi:hypothetical protein
MRTKALSIGLLTALVMATAATSVVAADSYSSPSAITGPVDESGDRGYRSVSAITGPLSEQPSTLVAGGEGYSSLSALVGDAPASTPTIEVTESSGFDWGDALIGALAGISLIVLAFGGARLASQARRGTVESSA